MTAIRLMGTVRRCAVGAHHALLVVSLLASGGWVMAQKATPPMPPNQPPAPAATTAPTAPTATVTSTGAVPASPLVVNLPDVAVTDHRGQRRKVAGDLVAGRTTLVHFFFTGCSSVCSPLTAIVKAAREELAAAGHKDVRVVSISVDPLNDTPAKLAEFAKRLGVGQDGWSLVSGQPASTDALLKAFGVPLGGNLDDHTPMVFIGSDGGQRWTRAYGLAGPKAIVDRVLAPAKEKAASVVPEPMRAAIAQQAAAAQPTKLGDRDAAAYFTNLPVITQDRGTVRFYEDLIKGRIVLVNSFFTACRDVCSPMTHNLAQAQQRLRNVQALGPVNFISLSVDAVVDTPEVLSDYARRHGALPGWSFVTGKKENVDWLLHKLGLHVPEREQHQAALWVGNDRNQTWLKLHALATPEAIVAAVKKVAQ